MYKYQQQFELNLCEDFLIQAKLYPTPNYIPSSLFPNNARVLKCFAKKKIKNHVAII